LKNKYFLDARPYEQQGLYLLMAKNLPQPAGTKVNNMHTMMYVLIVVGSPYFILTERGIIKLPF
jgi:hypothetical protein